MLKFKVMVNLNYQSFGNEGFNLRLRFYKDGETKYLNINRKLKGDLRKRHWNQKKQCFVASAPESKANNETLQRIIAPYLEAADSWDGDLKDFIELHKKKKKVFVPKKPTFSGKGSDRPYTLKDMMDYEIAYQMTKVRHDGTIKGTFEMYEKAAKRISEFCVHKNVHYDKVLLSEVDADFVNSFFEYVESKKAGKYVYLSSVLKALLNKAAKNGWYDTSQLIGANWKKKSVSVHKYETLTREQCRRFINMKIEEMPFPKGKYTELMRDFCVFILFTCQSPCDAICLKYENVIGGNLIFKRRKIDEKQHHPCMVPVNDVIEAILKKYKGANKDGYIFPIRTAKKIATSKTNNGDIKKFIGHCNAWLALLGKTLGCNFRLHLYTFRHTGITNYMSRGIDHLFVSEMAGTDVKNLKSTYYNCLEDDWNRKMALTATDFD